MKTFDRDDPRWTAYILDELEGDDRAELEAVLAQSEDARLFVESLRETTELLGTDLRDEPPLALTELQRKRIESAAQAEPPVPSVRPARWSRTAVVGTVLAAAAGLALFVTFSTTGAKKDREMVASQLDTVSGRLDKITAIPPIAPTGVDKEKRKKHSYNRWVDNSQSMDPAADDKLSLAAKFVDGEEREGERSREALGPNHRERGLDRDGQLEGHNTEDYDHIVDNPFVRVTDDSRSTFSIDVDTASYANIRRFLMRGSLPPKDSVRIEEMVNYFSYDYPADDEPFSVNTEVAVAPWDREHRLLRIGLKGREVVGDRRPRANLVFLIDVSGSMESENKLPLLESAMRMLTERLDEEDKVAIVVYAGASGVVLPATAASNQRAIKKALGRLSAGGSTNGGAGIELAYKIAQANFVKGGINRVILATDGDFNVGTTSQGDLVRVIEDKAKSGVFLTVLGFGMGNYNDSTLEQLADHGNGNYAYIDTINEARKVLVEEIHSTLVTIAKDVKIQIEFNPARVGYFRLIGYENRVLAHRDFNDDTKDAGEVGAGHTVTALYEIVPAGQILDGEPDVDALKYQDKKRLNAAAASDELLTLKLRFKAPDGNKSQLREFPVRDKGARLQTASTDFKFAAAVASFGMILRDSKHKGDATLQSVIDLAEQGVGADPYGYRGEFIALVRKAAKLKK